MPTSLPPDEGDDASDLIERAYGLFPDTRAGHAEGCPCCVSDERTRAIATGPRRELPIDLVGFYAFKAMSTWGDATLYRAMWPRIVECALSDEGAAWPGLADYVIADKLAMADVFSWTATERDTVDATFALLIRRAARSSAAYSSDVGTVVREAAPIARRPERLVSALRDALESSIDALFGVLVSESEPLGRYGHLATGRADLDVASRAVFIEVARDRVEPFDASELSEDARYYVDEARAVLSAIRSGEPR